MGNKKIKLAIIGCGAVVEQFHTPALKKLKWYPEICFDLNVIQAKKVAKRLNSNPKYSYLQEINNYDVAIVAVPHCYHKKIAIDLLKMNKHILIEKPIAATLKDAIEIMKYEKISKGKLQVGLLRRYLKSLLWIKNSIKDGLFGNIKNISVFEGGNYSWPVKSKSFWNKSVSGGGVLIDTGAHTVDLILWLFGKAKLLEYKDDSKGGVEADCIICLYFNDGFTGKIELSRIIQIGAYCLMESDRGIIKFSLISNKIEILKGFKNINVPIFPKQSFNDLSFIQLYEWRESIYNGKDVLITSNEAIKSMKLIHSCYNHRKDWGYKWL